MNRRELIAWSLAAGACTQLRARPRTDARAFHAAAGALYALKTLLVVALAWRFSRF